MAVSAAPHDTITQIVSEACDTIAELTDVLWAAKPSEALLAVNGELERLRSVAAAAQLRLATEIEAGEHAKTADGWQSTADYLTYAAGGRRGSGKRMLTTGQALCSELTATMEALEAGTVSPEQPR